MILRWSSRLIVVRACAWLESRKAAVSSVISRLAMIPGVYRLLVRGRYTARSVDLVFIYPEIPHNTGCAARLAAATGVRLHLVEPLGFSLEDRYLKRAGLDYWPLVDLLVHRSLTAMIQHFEGTGSRPFSERARLFSARGGRSLFDCSFAPDDVLCMGRESSGLPAEFLDQHPDRRVYVPIRSGVRSLNLANVACLGLYTAMHRAGLALPDNDGQYSAPTEAALDVRPSSRARRIDG